MAFIAGTEIFTDTGWKKIEDLAGRDRVLVRNFVGDAEFIQPFALKKRKHDGDVLVFGRSKWNVTVTPDHTIEYVLAVKDLRASKVIRSQADKIVYHEKNRIMRSFRYIDGEIPPVKLKLRDAENQYKIISPEDWVTILAYTLICGTITKNGNKYDLEYRVPEGPHLADIITILNRNSIDCSEKDGRIYVSRKNNLVSKLITALGARKRSEMTISDNMVLQLPLVYRKIFMQRFITLGMLRVGEENRWTLSTTNKQFVDAMIIFSYLSGYSANYRLLAKKGDKLFDSVAKSDSYQLIVQRPKNSVTLPEPQSVKYSGYVYSIDIFEGSVYVKNRTPVWIPAK